MQIESVLQTKNRSEPAKNRFSVAQFGSFTTVTVYHNRNFAKSTCIRYKKLNFGDSEFFEICKKKQIKCY